jgi:hypothetical protein
LLKSGRIGNIGKKWKKSVEKQKKLVENTVNLPILTICYQFLGILQTFTQFFYRLFTKITAKSQKGW